MTVEVATAISELVPTNPAGSDPKSEGDNHLRLIKGVLQDVFNDAPDGSTNQILFGFAGDFSAALRLSEDPDPENDNDIALMKTVTALDIDFQALGDRIDALSAASVQQIVRHVFTVSGTYSKPDNLLYADVLIIAGGGSGTRSQVTAAGTYSASGGGGGGGAARRLYAAAALSASEAYTVGAGGVMDAGGVGQAGGNSTFKGMTANGGAGGGTGGVASGSVGQISARGAGGTASGGELNIAGGDGARGIANAHGRVSLVIQGGGGGSMLVPFAEGEILASTSTGAAGLFPGGGGRGGTSGQNQAANPMNGGPGAAGVVIITEYLGVIPDE